jgi:DNA-binding beta-propeller fold protein YncE
MRHLTSVLVGALVVTGCAVDDGGDRCELPALGGGARTLAGCAIGDHVDGPREEARLANPVAVARGADGLLYVVDRGNSAIRVVDDHGAARTLVQRIGFERPFALGFGADGMLYASTDIDDEGELGAVIWRIDPAGGEPLLIQGGLGLVRGLAGLPDGRVALADPRQHTIRLLDPRTGEVMVLAGKANQAGRVDGLGGQARFAEPAGLAVLPDGRIAVADAGNRAIRAVGLDGAVTTLAAGGVGTPQALAVDGRGVVYVADRDGFVVRALDGEVITTVVGSGDPGWADSDEPLAASFYGLEGLGVSADGAQLWIADGDRDQGLPYHRVRVVELSP